jgi:hypothetical protein
METITLPATQAGERLLARTDCKVSKNFHTKLEHISADTVTDGDGAVQAGCMPEEWHDAMDKQYGQRI